MFWVTDNFLMHRNRKHIGRTRRSSVEQGLLHKVRIQYRSMRRSDKRRDSESDILLSADEELLDHDDILQRTPIKAVVT